MKFLNYMTLVCILTVACCFVVGCERTQQTLMDSIVMPSDTDKTDMDTDGGEMTGKTSETTDTDGDDGDEMTGETSKITDTQ